MRRIVLVAALMLHAASIGAQSTFSLVGTWRLVSMVRPVVNGPAEPYWDDQPLGRITYTADGHMAAQLYDARRARLGRPWEAADAAAARAAFAGLITYFGTYTVDQAAGTVTHTVEGAMAPDWIGGKLMRAFRFLGPDRVELRVVTSASGERAERATILVWERMRK